MWRTGRRHQLLPGSPGGTLGRGLAVQGWRCTRDILIVSGSIFVGLPFCVWLCLLQLRIDDCRFLVEVPQTVSTYVQVRRSRAPGEGAGKGDSPHPSNVSLVSVLLDGRREDKY